MYTSQIQKAITFATNAHSGQFRKGTEKPYIIHPMTVAFILSDLGASDEVIIAGLLHDTMEDCGVTFDEIASNFGEKVAKLVYSVTEQFPELTWKERKHSALERVEEYNEESILLKSADVLANTTDIIADYNESGISVFKRFNEGENHLVEHYASMLIELAHRTKNCNLKYHLFLKIKEIESTF